MVGQGVQHQCKRPRKLRDRSRYVARPTFPAKPGLRATFQHHISSAHAAPGSSHSRPTRGPADRSIPDCANMFALQPTQAWHRTSPGKSDGDRALYPCGIEVSPRAGWMLLQHTLRRVMLEGGHRRNREHLASTGGATYNCLMCNASISHSHQRNPGHWATTYVESAM
jgi:hypothetical protein